MARPAILTFYLIGMENLLRPNRARLKPIPLLAMLNKHTEQKCNRKIPIGGRHESITVHYCRPFLIRLLCLTYTRSIARPNGKARTIDCEKRILSQPNGNATLKLFQAVSYRTGMEKGFHFYALRYGLEGRWAY